MSSKVSGSGHAPAVLGAGDSIKAQSEQGKVIRMTFFTNQQGTTAGAKIERIEIRNSDSMLPSNAESVPMPVKHSLASVIVTVSGKN